MTLDDLKLRHDRKPYAALRKSARELATKLDVECPEWAVKRAVLPPPERPAKRVPREQSRPMRSRARPATSATSAAPVDVSILEIPALREWRARTPGGVVRVHGTGISLYEVGRVQHFRDAAAAVAAVAA